MEFDVNRPIYLQIYDTICDQLLSGALVPDGRIPSVREYGAQLGVNPNTIMRTYEKLTTDGIIYNKRGLGFFISQDAREKVLEYKKTEFVNETVPKIRRQLQLLGFGPEIFNQVNDYESIKIHFGHNAGRSRSHILRHTFRQGQNAQGIGRS